ncbi:MAG: hypothetical protein WA160_13290 [Pseudobdellovibrio sp.]
MTSYNTKFSKTIIAFAFILGSAQVYAASDLTNYKNVIQGINGKFDRDWHSLNPAGKPDPGALGTLETLFTAFNTIGITGATSLSTFVDQNVAVCAGPASNTCNGIKVDLKNSTHSTTLFGSPATFTYDLVVWMDSGSGFFRFIEGSFTPASVGSGKGNITFTSCSGCTPVGHSTIEWDATGTTYHLKASMYDSKMGNGSAHGNVLLDAYYVPSTGDMKISAAAQNACALTASTDSICSSTGTANSSAYSAMVHGNMTSGVAYVIGKNDVNTSATVPASGADNMCIKADGTVDGAAAVCTTAGIDNFTGMTAIAPSAANSLNWTAASWPFADITDTPTF